MEKQKSPTLEKALSSNILRIEALLLNCPDIIYRSLLIADQQPSTIIYLNNLTNVDVLQRDVLTPLLKHVKPIEDIDEAKNIIPIADISLQTQINALMDELLNGKVILMINGIDMAMSLGLTHNVHRDISEPVAEKNVRGPHGGFIENLGTNIGVLRQLVQNNNLKFSSVTLGTSTNQKATIAYIEGIANPKIFEVLYDKVKAINYDGLISIGHIEQFITDMPYSLFPQYEATERPDKAVAALLEGRFILMLAGTPVVLIAPVSFFSFFQATDDFSSNWMFGSFLRLMRIIAGTMAMFLPALYIAVISYHYYMIPLNLLIPLAESRQKVPFPPIIEALIMEATLELLREASIRLPTYIGTSLGVVGGLIIGQAAVDAGIVSSLMIIVVAVTAISTFLVPSYDMELSIRISRFIIMILASIFGIIGIVISAATILAHLIDLKSLGQPYFQPLMPLKLNDLKDTLIRMPIAMLRKRPNIAKPIDKTRGRKNE